MFFFYHKQALITHCKHHKKTFSWLLELLDDCIFLIKIVMRNLLAVVRIVLYLFAGFNHELASSCGQRQLIAALNLDYDIKLPLQLI